MADTLARASVAVERIEELFATESQVRELPGARPAPPLEGRVEFRHVQFGYRADRPVLNDVSLAVEPGHIAALVGPTGGGKSSLIGLIPRLYDVTGGAVLIDGTDVRDYTLDSLRDQVSFVLQEPVLFHESIRDNIAYGRPGAPFEDIVRAASFAHAHDFISRLPDGYETIVGERGETLSMGERQRISIARAVLRDAPILLLDEPSSALDAASEKLVLDALERLMRGRTCIIIAHRLATARRANVIFVLEHGGIVDAGTHEELLGRDGLYAHLTELQQEAVHAPVLQAR
jgi:subfamily B ATP-binding cassette protein MsbA